MAMVMGMVAGKHGLDVRGLRIEVRMELAAPPVNRIGSITLAVILPRKFSEAEREKLRSAVGLCPVHNSLHPETRLAVEMREG